MKTTRHRDWIVVIALLTAAAAAHAQAPAFLVKDIDLRPDTLGSGPGPFWPVGDTVLFRADQPTTGRELWRTDGTPAGTQIVRDIRPGTVWSQSHFVAVIGNTLFFVADDGEHGSELWRSDGTTEGTVLVRDIAPGSASSMSSSVDFAVMDGSLYFGADGEIWRSDGTTDGTFPVVSLPAGISEPGGAGGLVVFGDHLYFSAFQQATGWELWRSDGTAGNAELVKDIYLGPGSSGIGARFATAEALYFTADDGLGFGNELWKSDGTGPGTVRVKDIAPGPASSYVRNLGALGNTLLFNRGESSAQLWKSDGTEEGTVLVETVFGGSSLSQGLGGFQTLGGVSIFSYGRWDSRPELWRTDGTAEGTFFLAYSSGAPSVIGDIAYFTGFDESAGDELWTTDGTVPGTQRFADLRPGPLGSSAGSVADAGGFLLLEANDGISGAELWRSDGTQLGTALLTDIRLAPYNEDPIYPLYYDAIDFEGTLMFSADDHVFGGEPWRSDGSEAGTTLFADILPGETGSNAGLFMRVGDRVYFHANDGVVGPELWYTDGVGTTLLGDFSTGSIFGTRLLAPLGDQLLLRVSDGIHVCGVWSSNGTAGNAVPICNASPGAPSPPGVPQEWVAIGAAFFFTADDGEHGVELWRTRGTPPTTFRMTDFPLPSDERPERLVRFDDELWFTHRSSNSVTLWHTNGTWGGAVPLRSFGWIDALLVPTGDSLYFFATDPADGEGLWKTDGSLQGTVRVKDILPGSDSPRVDAFSLVAASGLVFFIVDDPATGRELWRSDGTELGTTLLADIRPGAQGSDPQSLQEIGGALVFSADDGTGSEPWVSDGTAAGTRRIADVAVPGGSGPKSFVASGDLVYFSAFGDATGKALWAVPRSVVTDADEDGLELLTERALGADPNDDDSDDDTLLDGAEVAAGTSPTDTDSDDDHLTDDFEIALGTDPADADSDGDGFADGVEYATGADPISPESKPVVPPIADRTLFDFETGTQGFALYGGAAWELTDLLGGDYAIGGDEGDATAVVVDLSGVSGIVFDLYRLPGQLGGANTALLGFAIPVDEAGVPRGDGVDLGAGQSLLASPAPNPDRRSFATDGLAGPHLVTISWKVSALLDDVTLIPEPELSALAAAALVAMAALSRRRR